MGSRSVIERALIVDSDPDERVLAAAMLREALAGVTVVEVDGPVSFAEELAAGAFQAAVVARALGWSDGLSVIALLRRRLPDCITVLIGDTEADMVSVQSQPDAHLSRSAKGLARLGQVLQQARDQRARQGRAPGLGDVVAHLPVPLLRLSAAGDLAALNDEALALFGHVDASRLLGRPLSDLVVDADPGHGPVRPSLASAQGDGVRVLLRGPAPGPRPYRLLLRAETERGVLLGYGGALLPEPETAAVAADAAATEPAALLYTVSHDLQQPLQTVSQSAHTLRERLAGSGRLGDDDDRILRRIVTGTTRMQSLLDGLLSYARTGHKGLEAEPVELDDILDTVLQGLEPLIQRTAARVRRPRSVRLTADRTELIQLLQNLLENALKFRGDAVPDIEIGCADRGDHWLLSVCDNGTGIDATQIDRLFEPFERINGATDARGSGLGLAACRRICERHGGKIWVVPNRDRGCTFYATIAQDLAHPRRGGLPRR